MVSLLTDGPFSLGKLCNIEEHHFTHTKLSLPLLCALSAHTNLLNAFMDMVFFS